MMRSLISGILIGLLFATSATAQTAKRPNIVFLLADDLGRQDCGFMGGTSIRTPHLDKLAKAGAKLDAFYVQPVCSPTRAAFMTGRYPMRHGLQVGVVRPWAQYGLPLEERTLAQALKSADYTTMICGKWHLGHFEQSYLPTRRGFDRQYGHYNGALDYFTHIRDEGFDWHSNDQVNRDEGYTTHLLAREAVKFVEQNAGKTPFFLYVPFNAVHSPHQVPQKYLDTYPDLKGNRRKYAGMLAALDEAVGQIVDAVDRANARQNTLFIFSSDNGGPSPGTITDNGPYRAGKGTLYEGGVRVAAFATWDGVIPANTTIREPLHMVDWYPTLVQLAGGSLDIKGQPPLDGKNLWPTLTENKPSPHDAILINSTPDNGAIRVGCWKLIVNGHANSDGEEGETQGPIAKKKAAANAKARRANREKTELFNLDTDPHERTNLASQHPDKVHELQTKLDELAKQAVAPKVKPKPAGWRAPAVYGEGSAPSVRTRGN